MTCRHLISLVSQPTANVTCVPVPCRPTAVPHVHCTQVVKYLVVSHGTTLKYKSKLDYNVHYSPTYIYIYLIMHCLAGFYFGFQMTIFNNLGRPLLQNAYGVEDYSTWLSSINLGFG